NELKSGKMKNISDDEKKHIIDYVERADLFIKNLNQRRKTLRNITKRIIEHQHGFLDTGSKLFLRPLTRVKIAEELGIHESTVSRATANKYVQIPTQEVVSFDFFFNSSHSVSDVIAQLIENEDPAHPLSDQEIARILQERGYNVARRTVVKYREAMKILSSRQRRR
ncbi:MAG: RNA polymerase sigma-54 factor, partial [Armatimonadota bacterium]|nr:RNA polymerase sigma-54 factor [Armatimonadota bacterium]